MATFTATATELHNSIAFEADCTIGTVEPEAAAQIAAAVQKGDQLTHVDDEEVTDRCELRTVLAAAPADKAIKFTVVHGNRVQTGGAGFERSVQLNGNTCAFAETQGGMTKDEAEEEAAYRARVEAYNKAASADKAAADAAQFAGGQGGEAERSFRVALQRALGKVEPGRCVIGVGDTGFNPADEVKMLAQEMKAGIPVIFDFGVKLRHRVPREQLAAKFAEAMKAGKWFVIVRSTKSMSLLNVLGALVEEMHSNEARKKECIHEAARIIISCEPHPHFPPSLAAGSKSLRIKTSFAQSSLMYESIGSASTLRIAADQDGASTAQPNKRVKMASAVQVVDIESREVTRAERPTPRPQVNVAGTVKQKATFSALPHDKFFGICFAGSRNRIALASSLGNVYIVDDAGSSLVSFHAHDAAVWDVSFNSEYDFVTGGEDQNAVVWTRDSDVSDALVCKDVVKCANDVYAVKHSRSGNAVAVGGLMPKITIRGTQTGKVEHVGLPTSNQAMCCVGSDGIASGGGDGSVFLIDTATAKLVSTCSQHTKKCPAVASSGDIVISGSFDCTVRLWDTRSATGQSIHTMKFQHYVTGLSADDNYLTACVGDNLYLWDTRKLAVVLGGQPQAWTGLSRAVCIDATSRQIVTASPDGVARFWSFAAE